MTPPTRGYELMRKAVLELSLSQEFTRQFADPRQVQPYTYSESPINSFRNRDAAFTAGPVAGSAAINRKVSDNDYLLDHLGLGFTGLFFTDQEQVSTEILDLFTQLAVADQNFTALVISRRSLHQDGIKVIEDSQGNSFEGYAAHDGTFYLLRPDRHITARWISIETEEVKHAQLTALGGNE